MLIQCPSCSARYKINPQQTSKDTVRIKCPRCSEVFQVNVESSAAEATATAAPTPAAASGPPKVLVVEDSKFFRELVKDVLKPLNLVFLFAGTGEEAWQIITTEKPDLVILDLNLPGKNGYQLIREVRAESSLNNIRLLAMSGVYRRESDAAAIERAGADDFINKSFKPEQLQERVQALLASR